MAYERYSVYHACVGQSSTLAAGEVVVKLDAQPWRSKAATCRSTIRYSSTDGRQVIHNHLACLALHFSVLSAATSAPVSYGTCNVAKAGAYGVDRASLSGGH